MYQINVENEKMILIKGDKSYIEFEETANEFKMNILDITGFDATKSEFKELIGNTSLKTKNIILTLEELDEKTKDLLLNLGFYFQGIEFNPKTELLEESYIYKYKEDKLITDTQLEKILEKLELN